MSSDNPYYSIVVGESCIDPSFKITMSVDSYEYLKGRGIFDEYMRHQFQMKMIRNRSKLHVKKGHITKESDSMPSLSRKDREVLVELKELNNTKFWEIASGCLIGARFNTTDYYNRGNNAYWIRFN